MWLLDVRTIEPIGRAANPEKRFRFKWVGTKKKAEPVEEVLELVL